MKLILQGLLATTLLSLAAADNYATYPQVPQTASINGFADPIYDLLPSCAKSCVKFSTGNTPCPYWDTGCLCVMPQWSGEVAQCIAENCVDGDVSSATNLAESLCQKVGANTWMMPASISTDLSVAANKEAAVTASASTPESSSVATVSAGASISAPAVSSTTTYESTAADSTLPTTTAKITTDSAASSAPENTTNSAASSAAASSAASADTASAKSGERTTAQESSSSSTPEVSSVTATDNQAISGTSISILSILGSIISLLI